MKKTLIAASILLASFAHAGEKELTFYKDLTHYKEMKSVDLSEDVYITLTNTAVLDTFNVSLKNEDQLLRLASVEIHPQSEENIFKLNKNAKVFINEKEYTLIENGKGFIKVKNQDGLVTFIPKSNIKEISFTNDLNATSHIAKVISPQKELTNVDMAFSYSLGEMSWKPKYDVYIKNKDVVQLDYNIEIDNETLTTFEDVDVNFMLEDIDRVYRDYISDNNGGIFDYNQYMIVTINSKGQMERSYEARTFNAAGYDRYGYDKEGFDAQGFTREGFQKVSSVLKDGKRSFEFSNKVTIPAKAKTLYPYQSAIELSYEKENKLYVSSNYEEDDYFVPSATMKIKNKDGLELSSGILRLFSGNKGYESTVIKEQYIHENKGKEDISLHLGDNYAISVYVEDNDELFNIKTTYDHANDGSITSLAKSKDLYILEFSANKVSLGIENKGSDKTLKLLPSSSDEIFVKASSLPEIKKILSEYDLKDTLSRKSKLILEEKLRTFAIDNKEIDLTEEKGNILYIVNTKMERGMR